MREICVVRYVNGWFFDVVWWFNIFVEVVVGVVGLEGLI